MSTIEKVPTLLKLLKYFKCLLVFQFVSRFNIISRDTYFGCIFTIKRCFSTTKMNQSSVSINNKVSVWNNFVWYGKQPVKVSIQRSNKMVSLVYLFGCHTAEAWNLSVLNLRNSQIRVLFFCFGNILFYIPLSGTVYLSDGM